MDLHTQQRLQDPSDFDLELTILALSQPAAGVFRVKFSDGHEASFSAEEILAEAALADNSHDCPAPKLWDGSLTSFRGPGGAPTRRRRNCCPGLSPSSATAS